MRLGDDILTLGLAPAWDLTCAGRGLDWNRHPRLDEQALRAAGKALNVARTLAWLGRSSRAAGCWGQEDLALCTAHLAATCPAVQPCLSAVPGRTRINVTVLDRRPRRELHLRAPNRLAGPRALRTLRRDLSGLVREGTVTVLAGALPEDAAGVLSLARTLTRPAGTRLILDSHGPLLGRLVAAGLCQLIAPNVAELRDLLQQALPDRLPVLLRAARGLLDRVPALLLSRGRRGALLVTRTGAWSAACSRPNDEPVVSTVGCGDSLLGGLLHALAEGHRPDRALATALRVATARAWGWTETRTWAAAQRRIPVTVRRLT